MAYTAQLTEAASDFHERMFPGYVSDFLRIDPRSSSNASTTLLSTRW